MPANVTVAAGDISLPSDVINSTAPVKTDIKDVKPNYLIGYLDILGFKDLVKDLPLECVYKSVCRVADLIETLRTGKDSPSFRVYGHLEIPPYAKQILENQTANAGWFYFSDTYIFFIEISNSSQEENIEKFKGLCWIINNLIVKPTLTPKEENVKSIAFRGAISYGPCIIDKTHSICLGMPIIDASRLEDAQMWMGGAIHPSVPESLIKDNVGYDKELFEYKIPLKQEYHLSNPSIKYALNWPHAHPDIFKSKDIPTVDDLGGHIDRYYWGDQKEKRENTLNFVRKVCE